MTNNLNEPETNDTDNYLSFFNYFILLIVGLNDLLCYGFITLNNLLESSNQEEIGLVSLQFIILPYNCQPNLTNLGV